MKKELTVTFYGNSVKKIQELLFELGEVNPYPFEEGDIPERDFIDAIRECGFVINNKNEF